MTAESTGEPADLEPVLVAALAYAAKGWPVFPVHGIDPESGACTCHAAERCIQGPGKHPWTSNGFKSASADEETVRGMFERRPGANVGLATGNGLLVIDCDVRDDLDGVAEFEALCQARGVPDGPRTVRQKTGGGGLQFFFRVDPELRIRNSVGAWRRCPRRWRICRAPSVPAQERRGLRVDGRPAGNRERSRLAG